MPLIDEAVSNNIRVLPRKHTMSVGMKRPGKRISVAAASPELNSIRKEQERVKKIIDYSLSAIPGLKKLREQNQDLLEEMQGAFRRAPSNDQKGISRGSFGTVGVDGGVTSMKQVVFWEDDPDELLPSNGGYSRKKPTEF